MNNNQKKIKNKVGISFAITNLY